MKLCVVAYKFGTEKEIGEHLGTYHYFIEVLRKLVRAGHEVKVIAPWLSLTKKGSADVSGITVVRYFPPLLNKIWLYPINRVIRSWYIKATQKQVLKQKNVDAILVWQARETGYAVSQIRDKLSAPFIFRQITTWKWHFERLPKDIFDKRTWYQIFAKIKLNKFVDQVLELLLDKKSQKKYANTIYQKADKVVFVSQIAANEGVEMGFDQSKIEILPVSIETDLFKPLNKKEELRSELKIKGKEVILFIGRINFDEKGIGVLLKAMPKVISEISDVNLVIVGGGGENERMKKIIDELKINDAVQLVGKKPFEDLVKYLNSTDVFVVPSIWLETFGQVTIEAMACGVPVVTSDAGASPYINIDRETGLVVPAKNSEKLAEAIVKLLKDKDLAKQFGQQARKRVEQNYTYDVVVNNLLDIIKRVQNEKRAR